MNMLRKFILILSLLAAMGLVFAQTTFYSESMGTVSATTTIAAHESADGFDVDSATYSGTADLRATTASSGYDGASGGANVFVTNTVGRYLLVEGINSSAYSNITMTLGHYKSTTAGNNELAIEVSSDGTNWTPMTYSRPTGAGTSSWLLIAPEGNIPSASNLRLRFTQTSTGPQFRIDDIKLSGTGGTPTPTISVSGTLTQFATYTGTPSASQSYTLTGTDLTAGIQVTPPAGFAISTDNSTFYTTAQTLASTFNGPVYVRLTGTTAGSYSGNIVHTSTGATQVDLAVSGTVSDPTPTIIVSGNLDLFETYLATPSAAQTYTLSGLYLTSNIDVSAPGGFELSTDGSSYSGLLSLAPSFNGLVYVRLNGSAEGSFSGTIAHVSTGATQVDLAAAGEVYPAVVPALFLEEEFDYPANDFITAHGWTAHSGAGTNPIPVATSGLSYTGYLPTTGLSAQTSASGEDDHRAFVLFDHGNVYASFLVNVISAPTSDEYVFHFGPQNIGTDFKGRFFIKDDSAGNISFGLSKASTSSISYTTASYNTATTYLVVIKYAIKAGSNNDEVYMWINPTIGATEPACLITAPDVTGWDAANIGTVSIRQGTNTPVIQIDGIRVSNDWATLWADVEPVTPTIVATSTPDPMYNIAGNPSEDDSFYSLSGDNLTGPITVTAPTGFEVSTNGLDGWASSLEVSLDYNANIYVRLVSSVVGPHSGDITHSSQGASTVLVRVEGETYAPPVVWNITANFSSFDHTVGSPSPSQSYAMSATNASQDITVTATNGFELSQDNSNWATQLVLASTFNGTLYVRLNSSTAGIISGNITHETAEASPYVINVSGIVSPPAGDYATDLFFSEYTEAASGNNKVIELFNGTGLLVDLSAYTVKLASNGNDWGNTVNLSGYTLAHNDVFVIANPSSTQEILDISDIESNVTFFNGDDALGLFKNDVLIDVIGVQGVDPGTAWNVAGITNATADHTLIRKPTIIEGNVDWPSSAGTDASDSEWIVTDWTDNTDLGSHTFTPGAQIAEAPVLNPASGVYSDPINVTMSTTTPGATIYYTVDGSVPSDTNGYDYSVTGPVAVNSTTTIKAITYATGYTPSSVTTETYIFPTLIPDIATLRAQATGTTMYKLTGEAVLTFQQATRHQKYIQDPTAAIVIDDPAGIISTTYNLYDGITGITGTLGVYNSLLQFTPVADPGAATSTNNVIVPEVRTLASLTSADQAKLIKVMNVNVDPTLVTYPATASNINVTDPTATAVMRTFPATDYSGTPIHTVPVNITCLVGQYNTTMQISPRFLADFEVYGAGLEAPVLSITYAGTSVLLTWMDVDGASNYRIEAASDPYGTYSSLGTTNDITYEITNPTEAMKFFRVIALN